MRHYLVNNLIHELLRQKNASTQCLLCIAGRPAKPLDASAAAHFTPAYLAGKPEKFEASRVRGKVNARVRSPFRYLVTTAGLAFPTSRGPPSLAEKAVSRKKLFLCVLDDDCELAKFSAFSSKKERVGLWNRARATCVSLSGYSGVENKKHQKPRLHTKQQDGNIRGAPHWPLVAGNSTSRHS